MESENKTEKRLSGLFYFSIPVSDLVKMDLAKKLTFRLDLKKKFGKVSLREECGVSYELGKFDLAAGMSLGETTRDEAKEERKRVLELINSDKGFRTVIESTKEEALNDK